MSPRPLTVTEERRARMRALYPRTHGPECADKYMAIAEWWRLYSEETAIPDECLRYAAAQEAKAGQIARAEGR